MPSYLGAAPTCKWWHMLCSAGEIWLLFCLFSLIWGIRQEGSARSPCTRTLLCPQQRWQEPQGLAPAGTLSERILSKSPLPIEGHLSKSDVPQALQLVATAAFGLLFGMGPPTKLACGNGLNVWCPKSPLCPSWSRAQPHFCSLLWNPQEISLLYGIFLKS